MLIEARMALESSKYGGAAAVHPIWPLGLRLVSVILASETRLCEQRRNMLHPFEGVLP